MAILPILYVFKFDDLNTKKADANVDFLILNAV